MEHGGGNCFGEAVFEGALEDFRCSCNDDAGAGAELSGTEGDGSDEALGDRFATLGHCSGEDEDGIDGAHFGEDRNGLGACCGGVHEGAASGPGSGEANGFDTWMSDEDGAEFDASIKDHGEGSFGHFALGDGGLDGACDDFGGAGVGGVGPDDDGAARSEGAGGVTSGDGEGEGKIGSAENGDRAEGAAHRAEVGLGNGSAVWLGGFDAGIDPGAFFDEAGKHAELATGATALAITAGFGEAGLSHHARGDFVAEGIDFLCDGTKEFSACFGSNGGVGREGLCCK